MNQLKKEQERKGPHLTYALTKKKKEESPQGRVSLIGLGHLNKIGIGPHKRTKQVNN